MRDIVNSCDRIGVKTRSKVNYASIETRALLRRQFPDAVVGHDDPQLVGMASNLVSA